MESWKNLNRILDDDRIQREKKVEDIKELLEYVSENDKSEIKRILLTGVSPNCGHEGETPMTICVKNNNLSLGIYFLNCGASASYQPNLETESAFWIALKNQKYDFIETFILNSCNITRSIGDDSETALIFATKLGDLKMVDILLSYNKVRKKVNEIDKSGRTALHHNLSKLEMTSDDLEIGKMLLSAGADQGIIDFEGNTAQEAAVSDAAKAVLLKDKMMKAMQEEAELEQDKPAPSLTPDRPTPQPHFKL